MPLYPCKLKLLPDKVLLGQVAAASKRSGFKPIAFRWHVERTLAWLRQCRRLSKEYEKTVASAEAWLWCAMMRLLMRRLAV